MAWTVQHNNGNFLRAKALGFCDSVDVEGNRLVDVYLAGSFWADNQLIHVKHSGRVVHRAALSSGDDRNRVWAAFSHQTGAIDRIDCDIHPCAFTGAYMFAVEEHWGFIFFTLADNNYAVHGYGVDERTHGIDCCAVAFILLAAANPPTRG